MSDDPTPPSPPTPPPATPQTGPSRAASRWLWLALLLSVGLNIAGVSFVAGALIDDRRDGQDRAASLAREMGLGPYAGALAPEDRRAIARAVGAQIRAEGGIRLRRAEMLQSFEAVLTTLRADPFDPAALAAIMEGQAERAEDLRHLGQEMFAEHLATLSPAERAAIADRLEARLRDRRRPGGP